MPLNGKPRLIFDSGDCERCNEKDVALYYVECVGRGPNGDSYVKIWLVCTHCFFDMVGVDFSGGFGIP